MNSKLIIEKNTESHVCRIPGIVCTQSGALLGYYECRNSLSDWAEIDLKIIRSDDEGKTWDVVRIIPGNGETLNNPVMTVCGDEIIFMYCENYKRLFISKSHDDGKTFTEGVLLNDFMNKIDFFYNAMAIGPGHGIVHNDTILVPIWFSYNKEDPEAHFPSFISTIYSVDGGNTWSMGERIGEDILVNPSECALGVLENSDVFISIRNENQIRKRAMAFGKNGYSLWSDVEFVENLADPICQGSVITKGNKIFHINCDSEIERENLTVKISDDDFKTFGSIYVEEKGGYSDIAIKDGKLYILYESDIFNTAGGCICFKTFGI